MLLLVFRERWGNEGIVGRNLDGRWEKNNSWIPQLAYHNTASPSHAMDKEWL